MKVWRRILAVVFSAVLAVGLFACDEEAKPKRVIFEVDGAVYATVETFGKEVLQMPEDPTAADGRVFAGWYRDKDQWKQPFTAESLEKTELSEDLRVYARWNVASITVTLEAGMGSCAEKTRTIPCLAPGGALPKVTPPALMVFVGWNDRQDGTGTFYETESELAERGENVTLYAIFRGEEGRDPVVGTYLLKVPNSENYDLVRMYESGMCDFAGMPLPYQIEEAGKRYTTSIDGTPATFVLDGDTLRLTFVPGDPGVGETTFVGERVVLPAGLLGTFSMTTGEASKTKVTVSVDEFGVMDYLTETEGQEPVRISDWSVIVFEGEPVLLCPPSEPVAGKEMKQNVLKMTETGVRFDPEGEGSFLELDRTREPAFGTDPVVGTYLVKLPQEEAYDLLRLYADGSCDLAGMMTTYRVEEAGKRYTTTLNGYPAFLELEGEVLRVTFFLDYSNNVSQTVEGRRVVLPAGLLGTFSTTQELGGRMTTVTISIDAFGKMEYRIEVEGQEPMKISDWSVTLFEGKPAILYPQQSSGKLLVPDLLEVTETGIRFDPDGQKNWLNLDRVR